MGKSGRRLPIKMRTLKYVDLKSLRKGMLGYLTSVTNTFFFVFCLLVCFLFYRVPHCKRIEIRSLCHMHQACRKFSFFFFFFHLQEEGGTIQRRNGPNVRQGRSRGMWGYAPWEILKIRFSVNAIFAF